MFCMNPYSVCAPFPFPSCPSHTLKMPRKKDVFRLLGRKSDLPIIALGAPPRLEFRPPHRGGWNSNLGGAPFKGKRIEM